jgi:hypothetical protein
LNLALHNMKLVLMLWQSFLKNLDQDNQLIVPQLQELILQHAELFGRIVLKNQILSPQGMHIKAFLKLYCKVNILSRISDTSMTGVMFQYPAHALIA